MLMDKETENKIKSLYAEITALTSAAASDRDPKKQELLMNQARSKLVDIRELNGTIGALGSPFGIPGCE